MKKIIKLTELELLTIVKKVISESYSKDSDEMKEGEITERCWKGYTQKGMKTMFGKRYPNCVKKESVGETDEAVNRAQQAAIAINMKKKGIKESKQASIVRDAVKSAKDKKKAASEDKFQSDPELSNSITRNV